MSIWKRSPRCLRDVSAAGQQALNRALMGAVSDAMGGPIYGFALATVFAALLFLGLVLNNVFNPAAAVFQRADQSDYSPTVEEIRL
jgi:hypothetical protein